MKPLVNYSADSDNEDVSPDSSINAVDSIENEWKVCYDQQSGYSYYWNVKSNQVSWDIPPDYHLVTDAPLANASAQSVKHPLHSEISNSVAKGNQLNATSTIPTNTTKSQTQLKTEYQGSRTETGNGEDMSKYATWATKSCVPMSQSMTGIPKKVELKPSNSIEKDNNVVVSDGDTNSDGEEDSVIISRIREKAMLLKKLGGDIPDELNDVLDESKTDSDILAELQDDSFVVGKDFDKNIDGGENTVKPLFPIMDHIEKENMAKRQDDVKKDPKSKRTNMKIIKLSSKAKELINASITTAKARATNFIQTEYGLKPIEEVVKEHKATIREERKTEEQPEEKTEKLPNVILPLSTDSKKDIETYQSTWTQRNDDKRGLGFAAEDNEVTNKKKSNIQFVKAGIIHPTTEYTIDVERDRKITKKGDSSNEEKKGNIEMIEDCTEKKKENKIFTKSDEDELFSITDEILPGGKSREKHEEITIDLCHLITEKLKFLSQSKKQVSPVQVMAIQIETLVGAWQAGAMGLQYLSDWLEMSASQLKILEEEGAPKGWLCEWDRSFGRYYYRNIESGSIQWDFPNVSEGKRDKKRSNHTISELTPPSPPRISDRKRKFTSEPTEGKRNDNSRRTTPPLPSVTPPSPPPPPPLSPPVPPAPIISNSADPISTAPPLPLASTQADGKPEVGDARGIANELGKEETVAKENTNWFAELNSFYSDIASLDTENEKQEQTKEVPVATVAVEKGGKIPTKSVLNTTKKKKKVKLDSTLSMNKKDLPMLLTKWQKVKSDME